MSTLLNSEIGDRSAPPPAGDEILVRQSIVQRTGRGVLYAASGQGVLFACGLAGGIILARLLSPRDFGVYAICIFVVQKLGSVAELGFISKLIHDPDSPSERQQRSVFTVSLFFAVGMYVSLYLLVPWLAPWFRLDAGAIRFVRVLALLILMVPLRMVPVAMLSRHLRYDYLTFEEVASGVTFQAVAILMAFAGYSFWSFGIAALASSVMRLAVLYGFAPWWPGLAWDREYVRRSISFGGKFQLISLVALLRDNIITLLAAPLFGPGAVGLLNWGLRLASICCYELVGICSRISFPSLSRMRTMPELFDTAVSSTLRYLNLLGIVAVAIVVALAHPVVHLIFTDKWLPAIPLFYAYAIRMVAASFTTIFDLSLKALGSPGRSLKIGVFWTMLEWGLAIAGALLWGYRGIAFAAAVGPWPAAIWYWRESSRFSRVRVWHATATPVFCGVTAFTALRCLQAVVAVNSLHGLAGAVVLGLLVSLLTAWLLEGNGLPRELKSAFLMLTGTQQPSRPTETC